MEVVSNFRRLQHPAIGFAITKKTKWQLEKEIEGVKMKIQMLQYK